MLNGFETLLNVHFFSLVIGNSNTHVSVEAIKKESFPRTTGAQQIGAIMQKNRNLERSTENIKAMFLATLSPLALGFFFFQFYLDTEHEIWKNYNGFEVTHLRFRMSSQMKIPSNKNTQEIEMGSVPSSHLL